MIYYNYSSRYYSPLKRYHNMQFSNSPHSQNYPHNQNYPQPNITSTYAVKSSEKNMKDKKIHKPNYTDITTDLHHKKNIIQSEQSESFRKATETKDEALFEILGIKLYFDDILLLCLIFFLYTEGVQDQYLFITLILLLLS